MAAVVAVAAVAADGQGRARLLDELRAAVARIERHGSAPCAGTVLRFGHAHLDAHLTGDGLALGALHEVAGTGPDVEHGAAAALFVAGVLSWFLHGLF